MTVKTMARAAAVSLGLALLAPALAQDAPPEAAKTAFEKTERLENLRYRHLWIAYGTIWLVVFGFAFRTWQRSERTAKELDDLKSRLADLEGRNG